jgi:hypothetical protein
MKTIIAAAPGALALTTVNAQSQTTAKTHCVIFEVTMEGTEQWTGVLDNVENLKKALGDSTEIEVVAHSKGLGMLIAKERSSLPACAWKRSHPGNVSTERGDSSIAPRAFEQRLPPGWIVNVPLDCLVDAFPETAARSPF